MSEFRGRFASEADQLYNMTGNDKQIHIRPKSGAFQVDVTLISQTSQQTKVRAYIVKHKMEGKEVVAIEREEEKDFSRPSAVDAIQAAFSWSASRVR